MHHALRIPELLLNIFKHLRRDRTTLACLARTTRDFYVVAVDILWRQLNSALPLIQLIPEGIINGYRADLNISETTSRENWKRFDHHACRVRELRCSVIYNHRYEYIAAALKSHPSQQTHGGPSLLPNLAQLTLVWRDQSTLEPTLFLSASLVYLKIELNIPTFDFTWEEKFIRDFASLSERIQTRSPALISFALTERLLEVYNMSNSLHRFLLFNSQIQHLQISQRVLLALSPAQSPVLMNLQSLSVIRCHNTENFDLDTLSGIRHVLPMLRKLSGDLGDEFLDERNAEFWLIFIPVVGQTLVELSLGDIEGTICTADYLRQLFQIVGSSCPSLQSLAITRYTLVSDEDATMMQNIILPLFQCAHLRNLEIESETERSNMSLTMTDDDVLDIAKAWPNIEILQFTAYLGPNVLQITPTLTLGSIAILCSHCPKLQHLALTVDARSCPHDIDTSEITASSLKTIDFGRSCIDDARVVAIWLGDLCTANGISYTDYEKDDEKFERTEMWENAKGIMESLQNERKKEAAKTVVIREEK